MISRKEAATKYYYEFNESERRRRLRAVAACGLGPNCEWCHKDAQYVLDAYVSCLGDDDIFLGDLCPDCKMTEECLEWLEEIVESHETLEAPQKYPNVDLVESLENQLQEAQADFEAQIQSLEDEVDTLRYEHEEYETQIDELKDQIDELERDYLELNSELVGALEERDELTEYAEQYVGEIFALKAQLNHKETLLEEALNENDRLSSTFGKARNSELEEENRVLLSQIKDLQFENSQQKAELIGLYRQINRDTYTSRRGNGVLD